jgi:Mg2+ and Co2+ transporter CorA
MTEIDHLRQKSDRTFILVCANFVMLFVLFCGLGYVVWRSAVLVGEVRNDLRKAEKAMAEMRNRIQGMDVDVMLERLTASAAEAMKGSVTTAIQQSDFSESLRDLSHRVENAQDRLERTGESIREIHDTLQKIDTEQLAQLISYHMLKGVGEGFNQAAESRKPDIGN